MANTITVTLSMEKTTKNTVKFAEITENEFMPEILGSIYVPKVTLAGIGYQGGNITVTIKACAENPDDLENAVRMNPEKPTKNTVKFTEVTENEFVPEKIGSVYIPKTTLAGIGYVPNTTVFVKIAKA